MVLWLTLRPHQHHGNLCRVPVAGKTQEVVINCLEADLILQAEDEHHRVHPGSKLKYVNKTFSIQPSLNNIFWFSHQI